MKKQLLSPFAIVLMVLFASFDGSLAGFYARGATVDVSSTLWNGVQTVDGWSGAQQFSAASCAAIKGGDRIVVTCTEALSETLSQVDVRNGAGWANFSPALNVNITDAEFPYEAVFEVTDDVADIIRANGMVITGKDFTFTRVAVMTTQEVLDPDQKGDYYRTVWEGNERISWVTGSNNSVLIKNADLGTLSPGEVVRVYYSDMRPGAVGRIVANWTAFASLPNVTLLGAQYYEYTLSEEWIEQIDNAAGLRISGNNYTAIKVDIIDPSKKFMVQGEVDMQDIRTWENGEKPKVTVSLRNLESVEVETTVEVVVDHDTYAAYNRQKRSLTLAAGESRMLDVPFDLEPGFYNLNVYVNGDNICSKVIGCRPEEVVSAPDDNIAEIKAYWQNELDILAKVPMDVELSLIESASTVNRNVYLVKMKSTPDTYGGEPVEIRGFYAEPVKPGRYPAIIQYQGTDGGTSDIKPIGGDDNIGWCELVISTRGQMLNNRPADKCEWAWLDPNYMRSDKGAIDYYAHGFGDKEKHYYRGGNVDCIRAIDFMESREKVHPGNIFAVGGSQGGSFVYVAAALGNGRIRAAAPSITGHSDFRDCVKIVSWPGNVFTTKQAELGMSDEEMWQFLSFYDVRNLATMVTCPVITSFSLQDRTDPPHINVAPFNNIDRASFADDDLQYVVNPFLGHATAADWKSRYMAFFEKYRTDVEPFDPSTPVIEAWSGSEAINWNSGDANNYVTVQSSQFKNAAVGSVLRMCLTDLGLGAQGHVCQGSWSDLADAKEFLPLSGGSFSFKITEAMLAQLKSNGLVVTGIGYTLTKVEIVNPLNLPDVTVFVDEKSIKVWNEGEKCTIDVMIQNNESRDVDVDLSVGLRTDSYESMPQIDKTVKVVAGGTESVVFELPQLKSGFYHAVVDANHVELADFNFGYDITGIESAPDMPGDFDEFWSKALDELGKIPVEASLTLIPEKSTAARNVYLVEMQSVPDVNGSDEPVFIRGYYAEPVAEGRYPALITYQGYDSDADTAPWCPGGDDRPGYVELILSTRGQMINNRPPYENIYGDWFVAGFGDKDSYYYRGAYMDAVRAIDFVSSRSKTDAENIFAQGQSQGGALTLAAAALGNGRLRAVAPSIPFMGDFPDYFRVGNWPAYNARIRQVELGLSDEEMYAFLSYFDTKNLAVKITCPVKTVIGLQDDVCPPHTNVAPYNNLSSAVKEISVNPTLKHSTHAGWDREFMDFFQRNFSTTAISTPDCDNRRCVQPIEGGFIVGDTVDSVIEVFDINGRMILKAVAGERVQLVRGVYIVRSEDIVFKIIVD